jgi:hypothetical protein
MESCNEEYADQLSIYGWLLGEEPGDDNVVVMLDELVAKPNGEPGVMPLMRIANHRARVTKAHQLKLLDRIRGCWDAIESGHIFTELPPSLNVFFTGSGEGVVTSTPAGINCATDCSASFTPGTGISLHAEPSQYSLFTGWTSGVCTGAGDCSLTMDGDPYTTAEFDRDTAHYVRIDGGSTAYYPSIQEAYNAASNGDTIKLWAVIYNEALLCNRPASVTFKGGYNSGYTAITGDIVLNGTLTISDGTVIADGLSIR